MSHEPNWSFHKYLLMLMSDVYFRVLNEFETSMQMVDKSW